MEGFMRSDLPLTVYFDASCPMCRSEILNIKAHDARGHLRLVDCSLPGFDDTALHEKGVTPADMMERLHVRDNQGTWVKGAPAMELIYRTAGMQRMANLWGTGTVFARLYPWIARHRQALSLTGIPLMFALWTRYASWRAYRRTRQCGDNTCAGNPSHTKTRLETWLLLVAWGHIFIGLAIPLLAYSGAFAYYSGLLHQAFWPGLAMTGETVQFQRWIVALFGPTIASVGVVMAYLVRAGAKFRERWPWNAILVSLAVWAPGDIGISLLRHFWLHVWIDAAALLAIFPPVLILRARAATLHRHALSHPY
jgi:predicted DCC family thiol-disulfide oxidoreductase YuxK